MDVVSPMEALEVVEVSPSPSMEGGPTIYLALLCTTLTQKESAGRSPAWGWAGAGLGRARARAGTTRLS